LSRAAFSRVEAAKPGSRWLPPTNPDGERRRSEQGASDEVSPASDRGRLPRILTWRRRHLRYSRTLYGTPATWAPGNSSSCLRSACGQWVRGKCRSSPPPISGRPTTFPAWCRLTENRLLLAEHPHYFIQRKECVALRGDYRPLLGLLSRARVGTLFLELATPRAGELEVRAAIPPEKRIGVGVVNQKVPRVEPFDEVLARTNRAVSFLGADRVLLNPDCGFATFADNPLKLRRASSQWSSKWLSGSGSSIGCRADRSSLTGPDGEPGDADSEASGQRAERLFARLRGGTLRAAKARSRRAACACRPLGGHEAFAVGVEGVGRDVDGEVRSATKEVTRASRPPTLNRSFFRPQILRPFESTQVSAESARCQRQPHAAERRKALFGEQRQRPARDESPVSL